MATAIESEHYNHIGRSLYDKSGIYDDELLRWIAEAEYLGVSRETAILVATKRRALSLNKATASLDNLQCTSCTDNISNVSNLHMEIQAVPTVSTMATTTVALNNGSSPMGIPEDIIKKKRRNRRRRKNKLISNISSINNEKSIHFSGITNDVNHSIVNTGNNGITMNFSDDNSSVDTTMGIVNAGCETEKMNHLCSLDAAVAAQSFNPFLTTNSVRQRRKRRVYKNPKSSVINIQDSHQHLSNTNSISDVSNNFPVTSSPCVKRNFRRRFRKNKFHNLTSTTISPEIKPMQRRSGRRYNYDRGRRRPGKSDVVNHVREQLRLTYEARGLDM
ncbi:hypothetical protein cand_004440 [Cryptosporidium andersoni]|uniref:Uncharacterized protein n=1 Tax=Cryptosporidium andersoni TaxID=117008 RepID=A0A1J4MNQ2_9CRYT|nr:hypothetical protein cand_004440 [Cryptosporidium andersoni]